MIIETQSLHKSLSHNNGDGGDDDDHDDIIVYSINEEHDRKQIK
jgi:hypothetical protein